MFCCKCQNDLADCICPDIKERLASITKMNKGKFVYRKCVKCGEHYSRCKCEQPEWNIEGAPRDLPGEKEKN